MAASEDKQTDEDANEVATKTTTATDKDECVRAGASAAPTPLAASEDNQTEEDANVMAIMTATATNKDECVRAGVSASPMPVAARDHNQTDENAIEVTTGSGGVMME